MAQDISYFDTGYIDQRYFIRTAEAEALLDATTSQQALSTKFRTVTSSVSSTASFRASALEIIGPGNRTFITLVGDLNG